jgi:outer membrane protein insertion porin family
LRHLLVILGLAAASAPPVGAADAVVDAPPAVADSVVAAASGPAEAPLVLERWALEGDPLVDAREAGRILPWAPGDSLPADGPERAADLLRQRLVDAGWWAATVSGEVRALEERPERGVVALRIDAGEPVVVGEIEVRGNLLLTREEILARVATRPGNVFDRATLLGDLDRVLRAYSERGYPLARVYPSRFRRTDDGRLGFDLRLGEGPQATIESVRVFGNDRTNPGVVARIAGVRPGDRWDVRRVERMDDRLRREGLFRTVSEPRVVRGSRDARIGLEIEVEEAPANSFFGVLGYNRNEEGDGEVVGMVDVDLRNILGTARRAAFRFERMASNVRDLEFRYREPWLLSTPISVEVGAAQTLRDTLYSRTDLDLALAFPIGPRTEGFLGAERRESTFDVVPDSSVTETSTGGSVGFRADWRDRRLNPSRGLWSESRIGARITGDDTQRTRFETENQVLVPLIGRWLLSVRGGFRGIWSSDDVVPLYEQYFLGGTNTVRGYNEDQFRGEQVWWVRNELRWRIGLESRVYAFGDAGGWRFRTPLPTGGFAVDRDNPVGVGFGMALASRTGLLRFELALGEGDTFSDAKVHVGLEQEF